MRLGRLIELLREIDPAKIVANGFGAPASYRGYYEDLAFEPAHNVSIGYMLKHAESALGKVFEGYKGGDYLAQSYTRCWIADWGETADEPIHPYDLARWKSSPCMSQLKWPVNTSVTYLEDERKGVVVEETETEAISPTFEELHQERSRAPKLVPDDKAFLLDRLSEIMADRAELEAGLAEAEAAKGAFAIRSLDNRRRLRKAYWELSNYLGGTKTIKVGNYLLQGIGDQGDVAITPIDLELPLPSSEGRDEASI
jgi:hypothetical protein